MNKEQKFKLVEELTEEIKENKNFYIADISDIDAETTIKFRKEFYKNNVKLKAVKNSLLKKALQNVSISDKELLNSLKGQSSILFSETVSAPAKTIKSLNKETKEKPKLKGAFVYDSIYVGEEHLEYLSSIKSKEELIADVMVLLQSPLKNVVSALKSSENKLTGVLKALSEKKN